MGFFGTPHLLSSDDNLVSLTNMVVSLTLSGMLGFLVTVASGFPEVAGIFAGQTTLNSAARYLNLLNPLS